MSDQKRESLEAMVAQLAGLANFRWQQGQLREAAACYERILAVQPDALPARFGLAATLSSLGHNQRAVALFREVEQLQPDFPGLQVNFGLAWMKLGRCDQAIAHYDRAIALNPDDYMAHNNRGNALRAQQRSPEAIESFRRALAIKPDHARAHSNLLLTLNYVEASQAAIYQESLRFEACQAAALAPAGRTYPNSRESRRVLRVGYVSADFCRHSVAYFLKAVIANHDREQVEIFCYSTGGRVDEVTAEFQQLTDQWRSISGLSDEAAAEQVRNDRIDILVDLGGHTGGNRLLVFARKPAPVQVTWLGYPNTTGLAAMDHRLIDEIVDPPREADALHTETLIRLPGGFLCYQPGSGVADDGVVAPPRDAAMTFGSFNTLSKVTADVIRVWSEILNRIPGSRLLLKSETLDEEGTRARFLGAFAAHGIAAERIELVPWIEGYSQHMALYSRIDIALDPFPYNGTTTTFEALWMGVPVIALRGNRHAGRVGASILHHAGLAKWIAENEREYIELAIAGAADRAALAASRATIASGLRNSPFTDPARFTVGLEAAYRRMWEQWCGSAGH